MTKPIKIYAEHLEATALEQFESAMACDFVVKGALMPDAHTGYSLPIGAVIATDGIVVPAWVGYDIGCGMCAAPTSFDPADIKEHSQAIFDQIYKKVPVGFKHNAEDAYASTLLTPTPSEDMREIYEQGVPRQLGTLGGGNHFIELGVDEESTVWIIVHSGSRGLGHKTATHYMRQASKLHTGIEKAKEGHYGFGVTSLLGENYIRDMNFLLSFAVANRSEIIHRVEASVQQVLSGIDDEGAVEWDDLINRNHNHAEWKDGLWVHRKGATHAEAGMLGVIPGNMRDGSFIVRGKGCEDALWSSSHGAGRVMSRKQAKEELEVEAFEETMQGIQALVGQGTLDESPFAYKNIFEVMALQEDLVEVLHHVKPLINIKG